MFGHGRQGGRPCGPLLSGSRKTWRTAVIYDFNPSVQNKFASVKAEQQRWSYPENSQHGIKLYSYRRPRSKMSINGA
jgi:hypothetical protein